MNITTHSGAAALVFSSFALLAQETPQYLDPSLPPEQRAAELVHSMMLEEKTSQLVNHARSIPRLVVPPYDWWSESLHGVTRDGTTEFPEPVGLAATFDTDTIHEMVILSAPRAASKALLCGGSVPVRPGALLVKSKKQIPGRASVRALH